MDKTANIHPGTEEIQPYVAIGPTKELSVTVHKETFDKTFIIITIIGCIILLAGIIFTVIFALQSAKLPPPPPPLKTNPQEPTIHLNYGASTNSNYPINRNLIMPDDASIIQNCSISTNTIVENGKCKCKPPFFGADCSLERHRKNYFSVGVPNEDTLGISIIENVTSNGKSFNENGTIGSCSNLCDHNPECMGFIYHQPGLCTLLKDNIIVPDGESIAYNLNIDSTLYMKDSQNLHFVNRIFLGEYSWSFPPRYWLKDSSHGYLQVHMNKVRKLEFFPDRIISYGSYIGIYSLEPFASDMIDTLIKVGTNSQCYIHQPDTMLNLPSTWQYKLPLYVAYIPA